MLLPCAAILYAVTEIGRMLLGPDAPSLIFLIGFTIYSCVLNGALWSYKIHRRRLAGKASEGW